MISFNKGSLERHTLLGKPNFGSTATNKEIFDLEDVEEVSVVKATPAVTVGTEVKTKHVEEVLLIDSDSDETGTHASSAISAIHSANRPTTPALPVPPESSMVRPSSPDIIVLDWMVKFLSEYYLVTIILNTSFYNVIFERVDQMWTRLIFIES